MKQLRKLLSNQCVVALDTNLLSALEKEQPPDWLESFVTISRSGVRFSIPDLCIGERIDSFENADPSFHNAMVGQWQRMASRLDSFIWQELPCLPLRADLFDLMDFHERGVESFRENQFSVGVSKELYSYMNNYENSLFNKSEFRKPFLEDIERERCKWKSYVESIRKEADAKTKEQILSSYLSEIDDSFASLAVSSTLLELPIRFAVERAFDPEYDPCAKKCKYKGTKIKPKNDGLDYQLLYLTMLSVNVCAYDGFFEEARCLGMTGSNCCHSPETLIDEWGKGVLPHVNTFEVEC